MMRIKSGQRDGRHTEASQVEPLPAPKAFRMGGQEVEVKEFGGVKALGMLPSQMHDGGVKEGFILLTPVGGMFAASRHGHGIASYTVSEYIMHCGAPASERVDLGEKVDAEGFRRLAAAAGLDFKGQSLRLDDSEPGYWELQTTEHQFWRMKRDEFGLKLQWQGPEDYHDLRVSDFRYVRINADEEGGRLVADVSLEAKVYFQGMRIDAIMAGPERKFRLELFDDDPRADRVVDAFGRLGVKKDSLVFDPTAFRPKCK